MNKIIRAVFIAFWTVLISFFAGILLLILVYGWGPGDEKRALTMAEEIMKRNALNSDMFEGVKIVNQQNGISHFYWYKKTDKSVYIFIVPDENIGCLERKESEFNRIKIDCLIKAP